MAFVEGVDGFQYDRFLFSPVWNDEFDRIGAIHLEYEENWESSPPVNIYRDTFLSKEDVGRLISYLQKQLEEM